MNIRTYTGPILASILAALLFLSTPAPKAFAAESPAPELTPDETYKLLQLFGNVFERVRADYVEKPSDQKLIEAAINGMLSSLDPHSSYMTARAFNDMRVETKGEFGGLGITVTMEGGLVKVVSPIDDTPAARGGLKPNDLITHLDGEPVMGLTLSEAVDRMRGPVGKDLVLKIVREGQKPFEVTLTRAVIPLRTVKDHLEGDISYLRITSFNGKPTAGLKKALLAQKKELKAQNKKLRGVVLDLRNNPGGLLNEAISVSDVFMSKGEVVSIRSQQHPENAQRFNARPGDMIDGLPLVVLVNGGSASASEIVAGALQDQGRGIIMGTKSFGKGSVQTISPLDGGKLGAMRMTTARYYTPSGRSIQSVGITPDIIVPQSKLKVVEPTSQRRERDLRGALDKENGKAADEKAKKNGKAKKDAPQDYQLTRALDLINGITLYSNMSN